MDIEEYLRLVATQIQTAGGRGDLAEVKRLLEVCADTLLDKAKEIGGGDSGS